MKNDSSSDIENKNYNTLNVIPLSPTIGAEIQCGDLRQVSEPVITDIRKAWLKHLVVVVRNQNLNNSELVKLGKKFGEFQYSKPLSNPLVAAGKVTKQGGSFVNHPEITVVSNVVENGVALGGLGDSEVIWHTDMSSYNEPPNQTILYAKEVPTSGGDTYFCNMYEALNLLPEHIRFRINELSQKHDLLIDAAGNVRPELADQINKPLEETPGAIHPLIHTHPETHKNCLYLGRRSNARLMELSQKKSDKMLDILWGFSTKKQITWRHKWKTGDLIMWDNRCVMHKRDKFKPNEKRTMHRIVIKGTKPYRQLSS